MVKGVDVDDAAAVLRRATDRGRFTTRASDGVNVATIVTVVMMMERMVAKDRLSAQAVVVVRKEEGKRCERGESHDDDSAQKL